MIPPSPFLSADPPLTAETAPAANDWNPEAAGAHKLLAAIEEDYRFVLDEDKFLFEIGCVPDDFEKYMAMLDALADDEPPLFLQRAIG